MYKAAVSKVFIFSDMTTRMSQSVCTNLTSLVENRSLVMESGWGPAWFLYKEHYGPDCWNRHTPARGGQSSKFVAAAAGKVFKTGGYLGRYSKFIL